MDSYGELRQHRVGSILQYEIQRRSRIIHSEPPIRHRTWRQAFHWCHEPQPRQRILRTVRNFQNVGRVLQKPRHLHGTQRHRQRLHRDTHHRAVVCERRHVQVGTGAIPQVVEPQHRNARHRTDGIRLPQYRRDIPPTIWRTQIPDGVARHHHRKKIPQNSRANDARLRQRLRNSRTHRQLHLTRRLLRKTRQIAGKPRLHRQLPALPHIIQAKQPFGDRRLPPRIADGVGYAYARRQTHPGTPNPVGSPAIRHRRRQRTQRNVHLQAAFRMLRTHRRQGKGSRRAQTPLRPQTQNHQRNRNAPRLRVFCATGNQTRKRAHRTRTNPQRRTPSTSEGYQHRATRHHHNDDSDSIPRVQSIPPKTPLQRSPDGQKRHTRPAEGRDCHPKRRPAGKKRRNRESARPPRLPKRKPRPHKPSDARFHHIRTAHTAHRDNIAGRDGRHIPAKFRALPPERHRERRLLPRGFHPWAQDNSCSRLHRTRRTGRTAQHDGHQRIERHLGTT